MKINTVKFMHLVRKKIKNYNNFKSKDIANYNFFF